jgi:hypothetical protein
VAVGFESSVVGLGGGGREGGGGRTLSQRSIEVRIYGPDFVLDVVAGFRGLGLGLADLEFGLREPAFARATVKKRPL